MEGLQKVMFFTLRTKQKLYNGSSWLTTEDNSEQQLNKNLGKSLN